MISTLLLYFAYYACYFLLLLILVLLLEGVPYINLKLFCSSPALTLFISCFNLKTLKNDYYYDVATSERAVSTTESKMRVLLLSVVVLLRMKTEGKQAFNQ